VHHSSQRDNKTQNHEFTGTLENAVFSRVFFMQFNIKRSLHLLKSLCGCLQVAYTLHTKNKYLVQDFQGLVQDSRKPYKPRLYK
jgi:hypothetical protein